MVAHMNVTDLPVPVTPAQAGGQSLPRTRSGGAANRVPDHPWIPAPRFRGDKLRGIDMRDLVKPA